MGIQFRLASRGDRVLCGVVGCREEDPLKSRRLDIPPVIGEVQKDYFFISSWFVFRVASGRGPLNGVIDDWSDYAGVVALGNEAAEQGYHRVLFFWECCCETEATVFRKIIYFFKPS